MSHRKAGDETEMKVRKRKTHRKAQVEMNTGQKCSKTQKVVHIIVSSDAETSLIFITAIFRINTENRESPRFD